MFENYYYKDCSSEFSRFLHRKDQQVHYLTTPKFFVSLTKSNVWNYIQDEINKVPDGRALIMFLHLWSEFFLEGMVSSKLKLPDEINWDNWSYSKKRELAYLLGFIDKVTNEDLIIINTIRNQYAHSLIPDIITVKNAIERHSNYPDPNIGNKLSFFGKVKYAMMETMSNLLNLWWETYGETSNIHLEKSD